MVSGEETEASILPRFLWLALFIVVLIAVYAGAWSYFASRLEKATAETIADIRAEGGEAECANAEVQGFPFRIGLFCNAVAYRDPTGLVSLESGPFRSAAQVYDPSHIVGEIDAPVRVAGPAGALTLNWELARASIRLGQPLPQNFSFEGRKVAAEEAGTAQPLFTVENAQFHMRSREADIDLATRFTGLKLANVAVETAPLLNGEGDMVIFDGRRLAEAEPATLRGASGEIRKLSLSSNADAEMSLTGPFTIGTDGLLNAELTLAARNPVSIANVLAGFFPDKRDQIDTAISGLVLLGASPSLPLTIRDGKIAIGFVPLGAVPAFN